MTLSGRIDALAAAVRDKFNNINPRLVPAGGTAGQVLAKAAITDYDTHWVDQVAGGGTVNYISPSRSTAGRYFSSETQNPSTSSFPPTPGRMYLAPFLRKQQIDALVAEVTTATSGGLFRMGLYDCDSYGFPNNLIEGTAEIDASTIGIKISLLSTPRTIGPHWVAIIANASIPLRGGTATGGPNGLLSAILGTSGSIPQGSGGVAPGIYVTQAYGPLPATCPAGGEVYAPLNQMPTLCVRGA